MPYPVPQSAVFRKKGVLNLYRMERARVNTTAVDGLSSIKCQDLPVIFFTRLNGAKCWQILLNVRYCVGMNTTHTQPTGIPASFSDKYNTIVNICNASISTPHRIIQEIDKLPLCEKSRITIYAVSKPLVCFEASIDDALIAIQKWQSEITK